MERKEGECVSMNLIFYGGWWKHFEMLISFDCGEWKRSALDLLQENFMMAEVLALYYMQRMQRKSSGKLLLF